MPWAAPFTLFLSDSLIDRHMRKLKHNFDTKVLAYVVQGWDLVCRALEIRCELSIQTSLSSSVGCR